MRGQANEGLRTERDCVYRESALGLYVEILGLGGGTARKEAEDTLALQEKGEHVFEKGAAGLCVLG